MQLAALSVLASVLSLAAASPLRPRTGLGAIEAPAPNTSIAPGAAFNFSYAPRADYGVSTYAYSVYLLTGDDAPALANGMAGHFFGRYDIENYPAVPVAKNPAPAQLVMPDFSKPPVGWAAGQDASDKTYQLVVLEEWDDDDVAGPVGIKFSLTSVPVVYNATTTPA